MRKKTTYKLTIVISTKVIEHFGSVPKTKMKVKKYLNKFIEDKGIKDVSLGKAEYKKIPKIITSLCGVGNTGAYCLRCESQQQCKLWISENIQS